MGANGDIPQNQPWTAHFFAIRILGYHFSSRLTATLNLFFYLLQNDMSTSYPIRAHAQEVYDKSDKD